jgi:hypothetical protein
MRQGIDHESAERLRAAIFTCQICGDTKKLRVDHCHATGALRGRICDACNVALGRFKDSPRLLRKAANYLEEPPAFDILTQ